MSHDKRIQERFEHRLTLQARQIKEILDRHFVRAEISGGRSEDGQVFFDFHSSPPIDAEQARQLEAALEITLRPSQIAIDLSDNKATICVTQEKEPPVDLELILASVPDLPPMTAVLGLTRDHRPVFLNLADLDVANILIAGETGSGKTALLQTLLLSLALKNKQAHLQAIVVDVNRRRSLEASPLYRLNYVPHLLMPVIEDIEECVETLTFLTDEVAYRLSQRVTFPRIMVGIDNLDSLLDEGGSVIRVPLIRLLQDGPEVGVQFALCTSEPDDWRVSQILKVNMPIRLVGKMRDESSAWAAAGAPESFAHHLLGKGDFVAVVYGTPVHFQAAHLNDYDLHLILEQLHRQSRPPIVARSKTIRPHFGNDGKLASEPIHFTFDSGTGVIFSQSPQNSRHTIVI